MGHFQHLDCKRDKCHQNISQSNQLVLLSVSRPVLCSFPTVNYIYCRRDIMAMDNYYGLPLIDIKNCNDVMCYFLLPKSLTTTIDSLVFGLQTVTPCSVLGTWEKTPLPYPHTVKGLWRCQGSTIFISVGRY